MSCSVCRNVLLAEWNQDEIAWFYHAIQYLGAYVYDFMFRSSYPDFSVRVLGSSDQENMWVKERTVLAFV